MQVSTLAVRRQCMLSVSPRAGGRGDRDDAAGREERAVPGGDQAGRRAAQPAAEAQQGHGRQLLTVCLE